MGLQDALLTLNTLIEEGIIEGYAIGGGHAVMYYDLPTTTYDLDILVILATDDDFHKLYQYFRDRGAKIEEVYIFINDMPVQFFPNYISPLFDAAVREAISIEIGNIQSRVVSIEYLLVLLLTSFRPKDKIRVQELVGKADKLLLEDVIKRFDDNEHKIYRRYRSLLEGTAGGKGTS